MRRGNQDRLQWKNGQLLIYLQRVYELHHFLPDIPKILLLPLPPTLIPVKVLLDYSTPKRPLIPLLLSSILPLSHPPLPAPPHLHLMPHPLQTQEDLVVDNLSILSLPKYLLILLMEYVWAGWDLVQEVRREIVHNKLVLVGLREDMAGKVRWWLVLGVIEMFEYGMLNLGK